MNKKEPLLIPQIELKPCKKEEMVKLNSFVDTAEKKHRDLSIPQIQLKTPKKPATNCSRLDIEIIKPVEEAILNKDEITISWDVKNEIKHSEVKLDQSEWINTGNETLWTTTNIKEGKHVVNVRVQDKKGNQAKDSSSFIVSRQYNIQSKPSKTFYNNALNKKRPIVIGGDKNFRLGKGFSQKELSSTKVSPTQVATDPRRNSCHPWNVKILQKINKNNFNLS